MNEQKRINESSVELEDGRTIVVRTLTLGGYSGVLKAFANILVDVFSADVDWEDTNGDDLLGLIPPLVDNHLEDVALIIEAGTRGEVKTGEIMSTLPGYEAIDLLMSILEVNDIGRIFESAKKLTGKMRKPQALKPQEKKTTEQ